MYLRNNTPYLSPNPLLLNRLSSLLETSMLCPSNPKWKVSVFLWVIRISLYTWACTKNLIDWHYYCQVPSCSLLSWAILAWIKPLPNLTWISRHLITVNPSNSQMAWLLGCSSDLWPWDLTPKHLFLSALALVLDPNF